MNKAFYIAQRYLLAQKGSTAVTFITWLAVVAMTMATTAMFVIISVFSGLEEFNRELIENINADLTLSPKEGKILKNIDFVEKKIKNISEISDFSKIIEEKVYITYNGVGEIAYLRAVDSLYTRVNPIDKKAIYGKYPSFVYQNEVFLENGLDIRLAIPVGEDADYAWIYMPKAGEGMIRKEEDIFNKKEIYTTGVFVADTDQLHNYMIAPIELAQELLGLDKKQAYQVVIKLKNPILADEIKEKLAQELGSEYEIKTKEQLNSAFWKMINTEKMMVYLIFCLVILITTFNLAGAIVILQLDKKQQAQSLIAMGFSFASLRKLYFYTGILIVSFGVILGLILGTVICQIQMMTGWFKVGEMPFPVKILPINYLTVALVAFGFGWLVSWIFSKVNKNFLFQKG